MATINLGAIRYNWKGAWSNSTAYVINDVVSNGGNSYVAIQAGTNQAVGNATAYWNIMSSAGSAGAEGGSTTLTTQGDLLYRDGSGLQRLPKGTAGQVLQMNSGATAPEYATAEGGKIKNYKHSWSNAVQTYNYSAGRVVIAGHNLDFGSALSGSSIVWLNGHQEYSFDSGDPGNALRWEYSADNSTWYGNKYLSTRTHSGHAGNDAKSNWTGSKFFNTTSNNDSSMVHSSLSAFIAVSALTVAPRYFRVTGRQTDLTDNNIKVNHCSGGGYNPMGGSSFNVFEMEA
tara:strand:+ start:1366 stop:2226 length:861 start_codon:yes stop_codon:yes gene_type:complete